MATDIAFSLGVMAMVKGIPSELKIFLLSLCIADDIGAIAVLAIFYSGSLDGSALTAGLVLLGLIALNLKLGVSQPIIYFVLGVGFWVAILRSGIHPTIAGVILGFMVPTTASLSMPDFQKVVADMEERFRVAMAANEVQTAKNILGGFEELVIRTESASERLTRKLNDWIAFLVLPLFALSNAGVTFSSGAWGGLLTSRITWGVLLGLVLGKPLGIVGCSFLAVKLGVAQLPSAVTWRQITAVGILAGIGFTVAIFISSVAFDDPVRLLQAKTGVLAASVVCAAMGYFSLSTIRES